jgi:hypothetical protein
MLGRGKVKERIYALFDYHRLIPRMITSINHYYMVGILLRKCISNSHSHERISQEVLHANKRQFGYGQILLETKQTYINKHTKLLPFIFTYQRQKTKTKLNHLATVAAAATSYQRIHQLSSPPHY